MSTTHRQYRNSSSTFPPLLLLIGLLLLSSSSFTRVVTAASGNININGDGNIIASPHHHEQRIDRRANDIISAPAGAAGKGDLSPQSIIAASPPFSSSDINNENVNDGFQTGTTHPFAHPTPHIPIPVPFSALTLSHLTSRPALASASATGAAAAGMKQVPPSNDGMDASGNDDTDDVGSGLGSAESSGAGAADRTGAATATATMPSSSSSSSSRMSTATTTSAGTGTGGGGTVLGAGSSSSSAAKSGAVRLGVAFSAGVVLLSVLIMSMNLPL